MSSRQPKKKLQIKYVEVSSSESSDSESDENPRETPDEIAQDQFGPTNKFGVRYRMVDSKFPTLKNYQTPAIQWMIDRENESVDGISGGILGLDMGLGKTISALTLTMRDYMGSNPPKYPTLVCCPLSAIYTWKEQIELFFGSSCKYLAIRSKCANSVNMNKLTVDVLSRYHIVIINYELLRSGAKKGNVYESLFTIDQFDRKLHIDHRPYPTSSQLKTVGPVSIFNVPYHRLIMDESHHFNNPKSCVFYSVMSLYSRRRWCLSGTPLRNRTSDLFSQFRFLGMQSIYNAKEFTLRVYKIMNLSKCILYMTKEDAGISLPTKKVVEVKVSLGEQERELYNYFQRKTKEAYEGHLIGCVAFFNVLTMFLRLRQCCASPYSISTGEQATTNNKNNTSYDNAQEVLDGMTGGLSEWLRDVNGSAGIKSAKISKCIELITTKVPKGEKVIVFSSFRGVVDVLERAMSVKCPDIQYETVHGGVVGDARDNALNRFKNDKNKTVLFLSLKVGSESLNLTEASFIIQMETTWVPAVTEQANARSHRIGQERDVTVWQLVADGTIEQKMLKVCENKKELFKQFISSKKRVGSAINMKMIGNIIR